VAINNRHKANPTTKPSNAYSIVGGSTTKTKPQTPSYNVNTNTRILVQNKANIQVKVTNANKPQAETPEGMRKRKPIKKLGG